MPLTRVPKRMKEYFQKKREKDLDAIVAEYADAFMTGVPQDDGHAHEAMTTVLQKAKFPRRQHIETVMSIHAGKRSGSPKAQSLSQGTFRQSRYRCSWRYTIKIPFISKLDKGQPIYPIAHGTKTQGRATEGQLYASRRRRGRPGVLMWSEGGQRFFSRLSGSGPNRRSEPRQLPAFHFTIQAQERAKEKARELGWRTK